MRWKLPKSRDTRIITKFLLFPRKVGNEIRWLETVKIKQRFVVPFEGSSGYWEDLWFVDDLALENNYFKNKGESK